MLILLGAAILPLLNMRSGVQKSLTLYCSHDAIFADSVIRLFEQRTGIKIQVRYDEEASKSLGLTTLLIAEKNAPRCDVFWNNQTLGTIRLKDEGVLEEYRGAGFNRIPPQFRDPGGCWAGFAARMRVFVINTDMMMVDEKAVADLLQSSSLSEAAIANPLYGTTLTQYTVVAAVMGLEQLKAWHHSLRDRGIREARGNGSVRDLVAAGACRLGFTDTDDVFAALDQKKPVGMLPVRTESGQTIVIPNSVAMIRGCLHPDESKQFIDFLLSEEVELLLARSASRQIPLGAVDDTKIPDDVRQLSAWAADGIRMEDAEKIQQPVLDWLSEENRGP